MESLLTLVLWQMYADVLMCLTRDPLAGNVSPALLGTSGTVPLSIVSTIPDIMRHYRDCSTCTSLARAWLPLTSHASVASPISRTR